MREGRGDGSSSRPSWSLGTAEGSARVLATLAGLVEKPNPSLRLVEDLFQNVGGRTVPLLVTQSDGRTLAPGHLLVVGEQASHHLPRGNEGVCIIRHRLKLADVTDAADRRA